MIRAAGLLYQQSTIDSGNILRSNGGEWTKTPGVQLHHSIVDTLFDADLKTNSCTRTTWGVFEADRRRDRRYLDWGMA